MNSGQGCQPYPGLCSRVPGTKENGQVSQGDIAVQPTSLHLVGRWLDLDSQRARTRRDGNRFEESLIRFLEEVPQYETLKDRVYPHRWSALRAGRPSWRRWFDDQWYCELGWKTRLHLDPLSWSFWEVQLIFTMKRFGILWEALPEEKAQPCLWSFLEELGSMTE